MSLGSISVQEAIHRGLKMVALPGKIILYATIPVCILILIIYFSWWFFLLLPAGLMLSVLYAVWATTRWRIWAYQHVADIHQFQRTAELAGLLMRQSHDRPGYLISRAQRARLKALQRRFSGDPLFVDDHTIPADTSVYSKTFFFASKQPRITLNESGIQIHPEGFFSWSQISNERIIRVSMSRTSARTGTGVSAGSKEYLRFESAGLRIEIPVSSLMITVWQLDFLLYIYRSRFTLKQQMQVI
jgi:hypothetical protein